MTLNCAMPMFCHYSSTFDGTRRSLTEEQAKTLKARFTSKARPRTKAPSGRFITFEWYGKSLDDVLAYTTSDEEEMDSLLRELKLGPYKDQ